MSHLTNAQIFKAIGLDDSVNPSSKVHPLNLCSCPHGLEGVEWSHQR